MMSDCTGTWYNELGSRMILHASGAQLWGTYDSAVGQAARQYDLTGKVNTGLPLPGSGVALGWTVSWVNAYLSSPSVTSWVGQYQVDPDGTEEIESLWLLVTETTEAGDWGSTRVGADVFRRSAPNAEQVQRALRKGSSHPTG
jgi:hypothetical protein